MEDCIRLELQWLNLYGPPCIYAGVIFKLASTVTKHRWRRLRFYYHGNVSVFFTFMHAKR